MGWEETDTAKQTPASTPAVDSASSKPEASVEPAATPPKDETAQATATPPDADPKPAVTPPPDQPTEELVPQKLIGQVAKRIREKSRSELSAKEDRIQQLEEENRKLREGWTGSESTDGDPLKIAQVVEQVFLTRQDAYGREKYGAEVYTDAAELIKSQNDPHLWSKIKGAASPADALVAEAARIAEEITLGDTPAERDRKRREKIKAEVKKELEVEFAQKLAARTNQPTDVQNVRAAGGDAKPTPKADSWATSLPSR